MASVTYMGRASRVRIPGGQVLIRGAMAYVSDQVADALDGDPAYVVRRTAPPAPPAPKPRSRPAKAAVPEPVAEPVAAEPASSSGVDADETVAAPVVDAQPDAAEGDQGG